MNQKQQINLASISKPAAIRLNRVGFLLGTITILLLQLLPGAQATPDTACQITGADLDQASKTVALLHSTLISVMQDAKQLGYSGRYAKLAPIISSNFNTPLITKTILGSRYWDTMAKQQKQNFIKLFQQLSIATYADRFDGYSGEKFVEQGRQALPVRGRCPPPAGEEPPAKRILIRTELQRVHDSPVKMDYLLQKTDDKWYIITVIADGVNDLSLKRGEYHDVIRHKGFNGLVEDLKTKIKNMENGKDK